MPIVEVNDFVSIHEDVIDRKVAQLMLQNKNKQAARWESYRNLSFRVKGFDEQGLAILLDVNNNEIHISKRALYITV